MLNALAKFKKVSIIVMINGKNQGGRCEGVKELCEWLSKLFKDFSEIEKSIFFAFNRYSEEDLD